MCIVDSRAVFWEGDILGVKKKVCRGRDLDSLDDFGQSCLHLACSGIRVDVAALLLKHGANVDAMESRGGWLEWMAPIHIAVVRNSTELVKMLISAGADVNLVTGGPSGGSTCLHLVRSSKMATALIRAGASLDTRAVMTGMTPLMHAIETSMIDVARTLVREGADVNLGAEDGTSLLEYVRASAKCDEWRSRVSAMLTGAGAGAR